MTDYALPPDPEAVVTRFDKEFEAYLYYVLLDSPEAPSLSVKGEPLPTARRTG